VRETMTKKPRKKKKIESAEIQSVESNAESAESTESTESIQADQQVEAALPDPVEQEVAAETSESEEQPASEESLPVLNEAPASDEPVSVSQETSTDDLLDDVRRSLMEAETLEEEKKSKKWWRRVAKGSKKDKSAEAEKAADVEVNLPTVSAPADLAEEQVEEKQSEEYLDEIDELIGMLVTEEAESARPAAAAAEVSSEPEAEIEVDIEEMKKQAFRPRGEDEQENITEVRSIALEDGEEVFVEVQTTAQDPLEERLAALENVFRPYRRYVYFGLAFLGLIMAVIASVVLFNVYQQNRPQVPTEVSNLPFPTSMSLPGGLNFNLGKGSLQDGQWNPRGPEWLQGTEVCRWVAIPWSRQLEAVIRTLNKDDQIEIVMSNNDRLVYKVYSVRELSNEELQKVPTDSPCLLLVLAKADSDMRWVLTALP
jgi:hypothetical protein